MSEQRPRLSRLEVRCHAVNLSLADQFKQPFVGFDLCLSQGNPCLEPAKSEISIRRFGCHCDTNAVLQCLGSLRFGPGGLCTAPQSAE